MQNQISSVDPFLFDKSILEERCNKIAMFSFEDMQQSIVPGANIVLFFYSVANQSKFRIMPNDVSCSFTGIQTKHIW